MNTQQILEALEANFSDCMLADGFEEALIGIVEGASRPTVAVYDFERCIDILMGRGMDEDAATEWMCRETMAAYVGENTPMFLHDWRRKDEPRLTEGEGEGEDEGSR